MFMRMFSKKNPKNVTKSIRVTEPMFKALQDLANEAGESFNSYVVLILDQYLQVQLEQGKIKHPDDEKKGKDETVQSAS